ncbi:MAG: FUSC family protein, partial [Rhodospirillaceae bacterium]|nr:FUSC family protein [Rhodospirillaceae bacterium]
ARLRVWGTVVGAAVAAVYLMVLPFHLVGLAAASGVAVVLSMVLRQNDAGRLAAITVTVIMLLTEMNPSQNPLVSVGMRLFEASLGAALAVVVSWIWAQISRRLMPPEATS